MWILICIHLLSLCFASAYSPWTAWSSAVYCAKTFARLLYAAPACWGYTTADGRVRLKRFLARIRGTGFLPSYSWGVRVLVSEAEDRLLRSVIRSESYVLRTIFPLTIWRFYNLRSRPHDFLLSNKDDRYFILSVCIRKARRPDIYFVPSLNSDSFLLTISVNGATLRCTRLDCVSLWDLNNKRILLKVLVPPF